MRGEEAKKCCGKDPIVRLVGHDYFVCCTVCEMTTRDYVNRYAAIEQWNLMWINNHSAEVTPISKARPDGKDFPDESRLAESLQETLNDFTGRVSVAAAIGILEILKQDMLHDMEEE